MSRKRSTILGTALLAVVLVGSLIGVILYYETLPQHLPQHETIVLGQTQLVPGSTAAMRVVVRDSRDASPVSESSVKVLMRPAAGGQGRTVFEGITNASGTLDVSFAVPQDIDEGQVLVVETRSKLGSDALEAPVSVRREAKLLVTTDKPLYQPGQVIHIRVLALGSFDRRPVGGGELEITVADGKGNTVFRRVEQASAYGVAAADFQLADEVNTGPYKIAVRLGETVSEKTVTVERYTLPKFQVALTTTRRFYQPGDYVEGTLDVQYFYGKHVSEAEVAIEGYTFDFERTVSVAISGVTDAQGHLDFSFELPAYIAGSELEGGQARFYLEARVTDQADHTEVGRLSLPVSGTALVVEAIPEGGRLKENLENILFILTSYPDGSPAEAEVTVTIPDTGETLSARTGTYGLAEVAITPRSAYTALRIVARDESGAATERDFAFEGEGSSETVLLRPDGALYRVGDTMMLTVLTSQQQGTVYLDIIRDGQTVSTRAVDVSDGHAEVAVDLSPDLYGTLEIHGYKILRDGHIVRDTRLVVVDQADDLVITLDPGAEIYRPGDEGTLALRVTDADGVGVQSAVGLAVVDESLFALAEQDPGFAKLYFMLEQEILQPRYELHGFSVPEMIVEPCLADDGSRLCEPELRDAREGAGKAALAAIVAPNAPFSLEENSHDQAMARAYARQQTFYRTLANAGFGVLVAAPLAVVVLSGVQLARDRVFWKSLGLAIALTVVIGLSLLGIVWLVSEVLWRAEELVFSVVIVSIGLAGVLGLIVLGVTAVRRRDGLLALMLALVPVALVAAGLATWAAVQADVVPGDRTLVMGLVAVGLLVLAMILRGAGYIWRRQAYTGAAALALGLLLLIAPGGAVVLLSGGAMSPRGNPVLVADGAIQRQALPLMGGGIVEQVFVEEEKGMEVPAEAAMPPGEAQGQADDPPRLREYFPETMLWLPAEVTEPDGELNITVPVADSITTWRISALASSQDGRLASATGALRVFQDFFIDLDLPGSLTVGDEISVPVGVFNYLPEAQRVHLRVELEPWFELLDDAEKEIEIAANDITVVYFRIRALDFGRQPFQVTALGSQMSDAIRKEARVYPDGKEIRVAVSDRLPTTGEVAETVSVPGDVIAGTQTLTVKVYPGVVSQVVEGLDALLRMPFGCFEQTSSTTYPNVLVLDYLKTTDQASPEVRMQAEEYINLGYQRLTTFEVAGDPGGFSLFGDAPADPMLTAYGLQEFSDMSRVYDVDPALTGRVVAWLFAHQESNGSWKGVEGFHETSLTSQTERLPVTAYIVWGLADAGYAADGRTQSGASFLREHASEAETAYELALVANALVAVDLPTTSISAATEAVLNRLAAMAQQEDQSAYWDAGGETYMGGYGNSARLETTAAAALAFLRSDRHVELANAALTFLVRSKDSFGTWETTSGTVMALKAFIASVRTGSENANASVTISLNNGPTRVVQVTPETFDVVQMVVFDDVPVGRDSDVRITIDGVAEGSEPSLMYQLTVSYYLPWESLARYPDLVGAEDLVTIDVAYDRTELAVDDTVEVGVTVSMNQADGVADQAIIDLGVPPGFAVETEDLARVVARYEDVPADYGYATIERFELTGRQIILYVRNLTGEAPLTFSYRLRAKFPLVAQTPASTAYDYYNPATAAEAAPQTLVVTGH